MCRLMCCGVNSNGNSYILECGGEQLILDAGVQFKDIKVALDFDISHISGVFITHKHKDHDGYSRDYIKTGIPVVRPFEGENSLLKIRNHSKFKAKAFALKDLDGNWVHTNGDGTPCPIYGYYITHPELGSLVYATDCEVIKYRFPNVNHFLIEANYDIDTLEGDDTKTSHVFRGHQSIQAACKFLDANKTDSLKTVILAHLSENNGDPQGFKDRVTNCLNEPSIRVYTAQKGMIIDL